MSHAVVEVGDTAVNKMDLALALETYNKVG